MSGADLTNLVYLTGLECDAVNEEIPTRDPAQCALFMSFWCKVTGTQHITLTAIAPDGPATTTTFTMAEIGRAHV